MRAGMPERGLGYFFYLVYSLLYSHQSWKMKKSESFFFSQPSSFAHRGWADVNNIIRAFHTLLNYINPVLLYTIILKIVPWKGK
jgi:hypothetical protein